MTQTKYKPSSGLIEVQDGTNYTIPGAITNYYSLFGNAAKSLSQQKNIIAGPNVGNSYSGGFLSGVQFYVSTGNCYLVGYRLWVQAGTNPNPTIPCKCALWQMEGLANSGQYTLISAANATSGTLVPGWNTILLANPIPLTPMAAYQIAIAINGNFNDTNSQFGPGDIYNGLHNGPLYAVTGANPGWNSTGNQKSGLFAIATDPTVTIPGAADSGGDGYSNFWVDCIIAQGTNPTAQNKYTGTYRMFPNWPNPIQAQTDSAEAYNIATEFIVTRTCTVQNIWFYSVPGSTGLPDQAAIWTANGLSGNLVTLLTGVSWSGAAGSGWLSVAVPGNVKLASGRYKVSVYDGAATPTVSTSTIFYFWQPGQTNPLGAGYAAGEWQNGPLIIPNLANAGLAYEYNSSLPGATPPYSTGVVEKGQNTFSQNPVAAAPITYPSLYVDGMGQNYLVDIEVI